MNLSDFHLLRPWWLLALPLLLMLCWRLRQSAGRSSWEQICDPHLLPFIISGTPGRRQRYAGVAVAGAIILAVVALAGPTWQRLPQPVFQQQSALVILLDLSRSMDCPDLSPSRLSRARFKVADILRKRTEGQTALVVFAGSAFTVTPLTSDSNTIAALLGSLQTEMMPSQGSRVDLAVKKGAQLIAQAGLQRGELLLIGDGSDGSRSVNAARQLAEQGVRLSVLGVGTAAGAPLATGEGFLQDAQGAIVIPKLDGQQLRELARAGGGSYQQVRVDDQDIDTLLATSRLEQLQSRVAQTELMTDRWQELGPWLLLPLLPLAATAFRRGCLLTLLLGLLLPVNPAQAAVLSDLWSRPDQQAYRQLQQGEAAAAAKKFTNQPWRAVANYRAGQFQQTIDDLASLTDSTSLYNKGNALAQLGRYPEALEAFEAALAAEPGHADAQYNRDLLLKLLQDQQQEQPTDGSADQPADAHPKDAEPQQADGQQDDSATTENQSAKQQQAGEQNTDKQTAEAMPVDQADQGDQAERAAENKPVQNGASNQRQDGEPPEDGVETDTPPVTATSDPELAPATERWLQQIPDDPGSLLRRKFLYQYQQQQPTGEEQPW